MTKYSSEFMAHINAAVDSTTTPARIHAFLKARWLEGHDGWADRLHLQHRVATILKSLKTEVDVFILSAHENGKPTGIVEFTPSRVVTDQCSNPRCIQYRLGMWMLAEKLQPLGAVVRMSSGLHGINVGNGFKGFCNISDRGLLFNSMHEADYPPADHRFTEVCITYPIHTLPSAFTFNRFGLMYRNPEHMQGDAHSDGPSFYAYPFLLKREGYFLVVKLGATDPRNPPAGKDTLVLSLAGGAVVVKEGRKDDPTKPYYGHRSFSISDGNAFDIQAGVEWAWASLGLQPKGFCLHEFHIDDTKWTVPKFNLSDTALEYQYPTDALPTKVGYPITLAITVVNGERVLRVFIPDDDPRIHHLTDAEREEYDMAKKATEKIQAGEADDEYDRKLNNAKADYQDLGMEGGDQ